MGYTLVLVGGSGQCFGVVVGWLNVLGILDPPSRVVIVDAEGASGQQTTLKKDYQLEYLLKFSNPDCRVVRYPPFKPGQGGVSANILIEHVKSPFWDLCLSRGKDEQERDVREGFFARPRLASTVFWNEVLREESGFIKDLKSASQTSQNKIVFVVGSLFGGTGAGLLPMVTKLYKERAKAKSLFLVGFTKYFTTAEVSGAPEDKVLIANAANGIRYFLDECLHLVDAGFLIGVPKNVTLPKAQEGVQLFPGFLMAASLLSDRGETLHTRLYELKRKDPQDDSTKPRPRLFMVAAREEEAYLQGDDIRFPPCVEDTLERKVLGADDLYGFAKVAREAIERFAAHSLVDSVAPLSLFPRRRMGPAIYDTLRDIDHGYVIRTRVLEVQNAIREEAAQVKKCLEKFAHWLVEVNGELGAKEGNAFFSDTRESKRLVVSKWRRSLRKEEPGRSGNTAEFLAQTWIRQVIRACARPTKAEVRQVKGLRWAFDGDCNLPPKELGFCAVEDPKAVNPFSNVSTSDIQGFSYPTPMGEAHAFAAKLDNNDKDALEYARILWRALALGWIEIENFDLKTEPPSDFERLIYHAEREPFNRFFGVLKVTKTVLDDTQGENKDDIVGTVVGGTHPKCGLWPGVNARAELEKIARLIAKNSSIQRRADSVLKSFYESMKREFPYLSGPIDRVFQFILDREVEPEKFANMHTAAPLYIQIAPEKAPEFIYPFVSFVGRVHLRARLSNSLRSGEVRIEDSGNGRLIFINSDKEQVAGLNAYVPKRQSGPGDDMEAAKFLGYGTLTFTEWARMKTRPVSQGKYPDLFVEKLRVIKGHFSEALSRRFYHRMPELLWHADQKPAAGHSDYGFNLEE